MLLIDNNEVEFNKMFRFVLAFFVSVINNHEYFVEVSVQRFLVYHSNLRHTLTNTREIMLLLSIPRYKIE